MTSLRAAWYAWTRGISRNVARDAVGVVDLLRSRKGWDKKVAYSHVDHFVLYAKVKGTDFNESLEHASQAPTPVRVEDVFTRLVTED